MTAIMCWLCNILIIITGFNVFIPMEISTEMDLQAKTMTSCLYTYESNWNVFM